MPHLSSSRAVRAWLVTVALLVLATITPWPALAPPAAAAAQAAEGDPLRVVLDAMTPVIPRKGRLVMKGTVTNVSDADFTRINLHAFRSDSPITDAQGLAASAATAADEYVGARITTPGTFDTVEVLAPGETARFTVRVPVSELGVSQPGVYWIGIHALGDSTVPRDLVADGRARTFIPLLPPRRRQPATAAIALPLRVSVRHASDGSIAEAARWLSLLQAGGRLDRLVEIAESQPPANFSWIVDPAVLTTVQRLAAGNPPRSIEPDPTVAGQEPTPTEPEETESTEPPATPEPVEGLEGDDLLLAQAAQAWLDRFLATTEGRDVLALPFGDLDVSAASRRAPGRIPQARARSTEVLDSFGITSTPALAPDNDVISPEALEKVPESTLVVLGEQAFAAPPESPHSVVEVLGRRVVVTSAGAQTGGPGPANPHSGLAFRQRLASEAALRLLDGSTAPVVLSLPTRWQTPDAEELFSVFDRGWLQPVTITEVAGRSTVDEPPEYLVYPEQFVQQELGPESFAAAQRLEDAAALMEEVLTLQTTIEAQVGDQVLTSLSQRHRGRAAAEVRSVDDSRTSITDQLASIHLEAPNAVTWSSDNGPIGASLVNGLDQPVSVAVEAVTGGDIEVTGSGVRQLAAGARGAVRLQASARRPGVHEIRLQVTSAEGTPLGATTTLPVRAAQVSGIIWFVMAGGAGLFLAAIGLRLWRRIRRSRRG